MLHLCDFSYSVFTVLIPNGTVQCSNTSQVSPSVDQCVSNGPSAVWISLLCVLGAALLFLGICNIGTLSYYLWKRKYFIKSK